MHLWQGENYCDIIEPRSFISSKFKRRKCSTLRNINRVCGIFKELFWRERKAVMMTISQLINLSELAIENKTAR